MSGKIREKSGNFEVDDKWQPCQIDINDNECILVLFCHFYKG